MKKTILIPLFLILLCSLVVRIYGLNQQGLLFIDEGTFVYRAKTFQFLIDHPHPPLQQPSNYADKKILWLLPVMSVLGLTGGSIVAVQLLSVFAGLTTILLTFSVARQLYNSNEIGLLSASVLGVSSMHIFYSRLAMPEMLNLVWVLLMMLSYSLAQHYDKRKDLVIVSGVMMGLSVLTNVFRAGLMPLAVLLMECGVGLKKEDAKKINFARFAVFIGATVVSVIVLVWIIWALLKAQGVWLSPYGGVIDSYVNQHSIGEINWNAVVYTFKYIFNVEGWHYVAIMFVGLLFIKKEKSTLFPLVIFLMYVLSWVFVDERAVRALTPVLPFIAIYIALTIYNIYTLLKPKMRLFFMVAVGFFIVAQLMSIKMIYTFRSDILPAIEYIRSKDASARILLSNQPIALAYDFNFTRYTQLTQQTTEEVRELNKEGFNYLITDFVKYAVSSTHENGELIRNPFLLEVERQCRPLQIYPHFNESLQRWMLMEVNQYADNVHWLDSHISDTTGQLRVYDLDRCLNLLK